MHHRGKEYHEAFKHQSKQNDVLCQSHYSERIVSSFYHQIKIEYYGGNLYVSIEVIALDRFSASIQSISSLTYDVVSRQAVFCSFLSDDSKQDSAKKSTHSKRIMELLQNRKILLTNKITI